MTVPSIIQHVFLRLADAVFDRRPCLVPDSERLQACRIISHRGSYDNQHILENTLAAFDRAAGAGVWGIEMDIRWTRDLVPVIYHDEDLDRLHGCRQSIASLTHAELKKSCPAIPTLTEVVARYGKNFHLMIEVKQQLWPAPSLQEQTLMEILKPLEPIRDYHLLTLHPALLQNFYRFPPRVRVVVADGWPAVSSRWVRRHHWGGFCGHYLLVGKAMVRRHHRQQQQVGTGFIGSRSCLCRELNRGIDWIFSNHAVALQGLLDSMIENSLSSPGSALI
jgi:glycerophosphoryl diester phosphodiesterase